MRLFTSKSFGGKVRTNGVCGVGWIGGASGGFCGFDSSSLEGAEVRGETMTNMQISSSSYSGVDLLENAGKDDGFCGDITQISIRGQAARKMTRGEQWVRRCLYIVKVHAFFV